MLFIFGFSQQFFPYKTIRTYVDSELLMKDYLTISKTSFKEITVFSRVKVYRTHILVKLAQYAKQ